MKFHSIYNLNPPSEKTIERDYTEEEITEVETIEQIIEQNRNFIEEEEQQLQKLIQHEPRGVDAN